MALKPSSFSIFFGRFRNLSSNFSRPAGLTGMQFRTMVPLFSSLPDWSMISYWSSPI
ncbi:hypothetical protein LPW40_05105 [Salinicoccus halitifaciens]|uniref:Uncharacterized protein n=1 Tax=Salinicoccus halitifaciens TaxID=1073415 RepID=A0ABV2EC02_9STAP|nr:hypothetical protein [Salinicoccus halitifaciens]MCD2137394.1 hypothetical protein [Salinicoccus halitifaciens]